jgi:hypothetical protein
LIAELLEYGVSAKEEGILKRSKKELVKGGLSSRALPLVGEPGYVGSFDGADDLGCGTWLRSIFADADGMWLLHILGSTTVRLWKVRW